MGGEGAMVWSLWAWAKHLRADHSQDEFVRGRAHVNGIEGFWGYAKACLGRFRGFHKRIFCLNLKECEFCFNHRGENLFPLLLRILRKHLLN